MISIMYMENRKNHVMDKMARIHFYRQKLTIYLPLFMQKWWLYISFTELYPLQHLFYVFQEYLYIEMGIYLQTTIRTPLLKYCLNFL